MKFTKSLAAGLAGLAVVLAPTANAGLAERYHAEQTAAEQEETRYNNMCESLWSSSKWFSIAPGLKPNITSGIKTRYSVTSIGDLYRVTKYQDYGCNYSFVGPMNQEYAEGKVRKENVIINGDLYQYFFSPSTNKVTRHGRGTAIETVKSEMRKNCLNSNSYRGAEGAGIWCTQEIKRALVLS